AVPMGNVFLFIFSLLRAARPCRNVIRYRRLEKLRKNFSEFSQGNVRQSTSKAAVSNPSLAIAIRLTNTEPRRQGVVTKYVHSRVTPIRYSLMRRVMLNCI